MFHLLLTLSGKTKLFNYFIKEKIGESRSQVKTVFADMGMIGKSIKVASLHKKRPH